MKCRITWSSRNPEPGKQSWCWPSFYSKKRISVILCLIQAWCWLIFRCCILARRRALFFRRSEEHTSELQSLMRISYAVFCLKKKIEEDKTQVNDDQTRLRNTN